MKARAATFFGFSFLAGCAFDVPEPDSTNTRVFVESSTRAGVVSPPTAVGWTIVVDPNVTDEEFALFERAAADWESSSPCPLTTRVVRGDTPRDPGGRRFRDAGGSRTIEAWEQDEPPGVAGYTFRNPGWSPFVTFRRPADSRGRDRLYRVIAHETGHAFGLEHDDSEPAIMNSTSYEALSVTPLDADLYAARWCGRR